ncbi:N(2),N(2)-dimethylguanosine tRNA methyltransferase [Halothece sp. PCC 7418]|uniref:N(2),N(2)-dimethylguanosine tRNA methyltransferase n=1 Tax=Halothece sp. (strain PCC 7418) TaxID=65093 RepID=UPI0002A06C4F|nr:N(2),N(2)-dimethylguanosine tRNA methyltransferase [Halothece sp. PCC 7418]AFZ45548.1 N(2),N(2)-dimethylguanosine tRNA methyltransferase [Halothece sp. PCC 7418]
MLFQERNITFKIGNTFYRPATVVVRDLGVLAATVQRQQTGRLRVLDAMSGCGIRALRYLLEAGSDWVWANEANHEVAPILKANLEQYLKPSQYQITHTDANRIFFDCYYRSDFYDLIDLDAFGALTPYLSTILWGTKLGGLVYLTSTDGRSVTGNAPENSLKYYGAYARSHPAAHEQGLRMIMGRLQQQAASQGRGVKPVFAYFTGETYRVMMRFVSKPQLTTENYGWLGYCHHCGHYQTVRWRQLGKALCPQDSQRLVVSGPLWLGALHDRATLKSMISLADAWRWTQRVSLLEIMQQEADVVPYFYSLQKIGQVGQLDLPPRDRLIATLQQQGYRACATHINQQALKTDADFSTCVALAKNISH